MCETGFSLLYISHNILQPVPHSTHKNQLQLGKTKTEKQNNIFPEKSEDKLINLEIGKRPLKQKRSINHKAKD